MQRTDKRQPIDFVSKRTIATIISLVLLIGSLVSLATQGLNFGIDFTGGTMIELSYQTPAELDKIREKLNQAGYQEAIVQNFGSIYDVLIRLPAQASPNMAELSNQIVSLLQQSEVELDIRRIEFVGPQVGKELTEQGGLAMVYALIGILIYVAFRFEYRFAIGSIMALIHDVLLTLGFFSVTQLSFDLTVLAAILAIIGYSLNDTIVVFDRIRETFLRLRKGHATEIVNHALNATLRRTLMTSMTTLLVVISLLIFGGEVIHGFALALFVGIIIGTYSSIYIASSTILALGVSKADLMPPEKDSDVNEDGSQV